MQDNNTPTVVNVDEAEDAVFTEVNPSEPKSGSTHTPKSKLTPKQIKQLIRNGALNPNVWGKMIRDGYHPRKSRSTKAERKVKRDLQKKARKISYRIAAGKC